jgi:hypothetical protein
MKFLLSVLALSFSLSALAECDLTEALKNFKSRLAYPTLIAVSGQNYKAEKSDLKANILESTLTDGSFRAWGTFNWKVKTGTYVVTGTNIMIADFYPSTCSFENDEMVVVKDI